ncbi:MAG: GNAT family N-acetyltransferase [Actinomycetota bacterium]|nr:GNAT family N-acetyltransferase [Actinomycetota bacterium]
MNTPAAGVPWSIKPTLTGELVTLRPFVRDDAVAMAAVIADPELIKLTASATSTEAAMASPTEPDQRTYDWYGSRSEQDDRLDLGIVDNATGELVGEVVLNDLDVDANSCNFRTLIGPAGRGRGLGTEAARLILGYGFEQLCVHRISLDVFAFNPGGKRVYDKVGFGVEGVRRDAFRFDGEYTDEIMMAILAPDWQQHKGHPQPHTESG